MNYDTEKTFRGIHGTVEALGDVLESLRRISIERPETRSVPLRLLTQMQPQPVDSDGTVHLRLTPLSERTTQSGYYCAVSYTWSQPAELEKIVKPSKYLIHTETGIRPPKCPLTVLHRAWNFALREFTQDGNITHYGHSPYLWIDQECIFQDDPVDVENHLQVMHLIYSNAYTTLAVLAQVVTTEEQFNILNDFSQTPKAGPMFKTGDELRDGCSSLFALLEHVIKDLWFSRTWTLHEKYCTRGICYLVPVTFYGTEFVFPYSDVGVQSVAFERFLSGTLRAAREWNLDIELSVLQTLIVNYFTGFDSTTILLRMEQCENLILTDRLAIFSNIKEHHRILPSRKVAQCTNSYSTCLLALLLFNYYNRWAAEPAWNLRAGEKLPGLYISLLAPLMDFSVSEVAETFEEKTSLAMHRHESKRDREYREWKSQLLVYGYCRDCNPKQKP